MENNDYNLLKDVLTEIYRIPRPQFTGLGLIVYEDFSGLPVSPLRNENPKGITLPTNDKQDIISIIKTLNNLDSNYHDGFHLLSNKGQLTHVCQYFSPPIISLTSIDYTKGGRYRAAQYGSHLESVIAVGIIGQCYGPFIFIKGKTYQL